MTSRQAEAEESSEDDLAAHATQGGGGHGHETKKTPWHAVALSIAALGVVFGDIGTSPIYAFQAVFQLDYGKVAPSRTDILGVLSMIVWSVVLIVTVKYVVFVMRADNDGEGGVLALAALVRRALRNRKTRGWLLLLGVLGACLFYGDSLITPAVSVISAFEGLEVPAPSLHSAVLPLAAGVLVVLFAVQRFGTGKVGTAFGPVMVLWFLVIAVAGIHGITRDTGVLRALSPTYAVQLAADRPYIAFVALGAVVLSITGCEALYADMGHFGPGPIRRAWFALVLPALLCNYLGQGALALQRPKNVTNPFFELVPGWGQVAMVVLAAAATVIASQAVISGAFSVSHQAIRLGFLPPLRIRQTSEEEGGQIYVPSINTLLFVGVMTILLTFQHSAKLESAYGIAVTGTLLTTTVLFLVYARVKWHWPTVAIVVFAVLVGGLELIYLAANLTKFTSGGWLPLLVGALVFVVMTTWQRGRRVVSSRRVELEGDLEAFIRELDLGGVRRIPGTAVYPHPTKETVPLALRANLEHNGVLHEHVVIVTAQARQKPHQGAEGRLVVDDLWRADDGIYHLTVNYGFSDRLDLPGALTEAAEAGRLDDGIDMGTASYFVSRATLRRGRKRLPRWQIGLFTFLAHNAADPAEVLRLPVERTVTMGSVVEI